MCIKYDQGADERGWLARLLGRQVDRCGGLKAAVKASADLYKADPRVAWHVLPELPSVTVVDLHRWVDEVAKEIGRHFTVAQVQLQNIIGGQARPMQSVLPQLDPLVPPPP